MAEFTATEIFDESVIRDLISHVTGKGAVVSENINFIHTEEAGTGIFATGAIKSRDSLVCVPFCECISAESVINTRVGEIITARPDLLEYPDEVIAMGLMYAVTLGKDDAGLCSWINHVKTIPKTYNTPLYWSDEELNEIKGYNVSQSAFICFFIKFVR